MHPESPQAPPIAFYHSRGDHSYRGRMHPLWDKGDHSEQQRIDLQ